MTTPAEARPVRPVAGPMFWRIASMPVEGGKRRKVLALLAAFEDGGQQWTGVDELAERLGWRTVRVRKLLDRLGKDGFVGVRGRRGEPRLIRFRALLPQESGERP